MPDCWLLSAKSGVASDGSPPCTLRYDRAWAVAVASAEVASGSAAVAAPNEIEVERARIGSGSADSSFPDLRCQRDAGGHGNHECADRAWFNAVPLFRLLSQGDTFGTPSSGNQTSRHPGFRSFASFDASLGILASAPSPLLMPPSALYSQPGPSDPKATRSVIG